MIAHGGLAARSCERASMHSMAAPRSAHQPRAARCSSRKQQQTLLMASLFSGPQQQAAAAPAAIRGPSKGRAERVRVIAGANGNGSGAAPGALFCAAKRGAAKRARGDGSARAACCFLHRQHRQQADLPSPPAPHHPPSHNIIHNTNKQLRTSSSSARAPPATPPRSTPRAPTSSRSSSRASPTAAAASSWARPRSRTSRASPRA